MGSICFDLTMHVTSLGRSPTIRCSTLLSIFVLVCGCVRVYSGHSLEQCCTASRSLPPADGLRGRELRRFMHFSGNT